MAAFLRTCQLQLPNGNSIFWSPLISYASIIQVRWQKLSYVDGSMYWIVRGNYFEDKEASDNSSDVKCSINYCQQ